MTAAFAAGMLILLPLSVRAQEVQPAVTAENHTEETMEQPEDIIFETSSVRRDMEHDSMFAAFFFIA